MRRSKFRKKMGKRAAGLRRILLGAALGALSSLQVTHASEAPPPPNLRIDTVVYDVNAGILQFAITFTNPSDSVLYLDCQLPPRAVLEGNTLDLVFARAAGASGARAGGPVVSDTGGAAASVNPDDFPPQRVANGQSFQGQRKLDRVLGDWQARPKFSSLRIRMDYYPERTEGEGRFALERVMTTGTPAHAVVRKGKPPAAPKVIHRRTPSAP